MNSVRDQHLSSADPQQGPNGNERTDNLFISLCLRLRWGWLSFALFASGTMVAQLQPAPGVEWKEEYWAENWPGFGTIMEWNTGLSDYVPQVPQPAGLITQDESGEDWHYAHCNLYEAGEHVGYITVGYLGYQNWEFNEPGYCWSSELDNSWIEYHYELETFENRRGPQRGAIARQDLDGELVWIKPFLPGAFYSVIQDHEGNIVAVGEGGSNREFPDMDPVEIRYNENDAGDIDISDPGMDCAALGYFAAKMTVVKIDPNGNMLWYTMIGADEQWDQAWSRRGIAQDVVEVDQSGTWSYYVAGWSEVNGSSGNKGVLGRVAADGSLISRHVYASGDAAFLGVPSMQSDPAEQIRFMAIDVTEVGGSDLLAISGHARRASPSPFPELAFCMQLDLTDADPYLPEFVISTDGLPQHDASLIQHTTGVGYATVDGTPKIIWPTLADYSLGDIFAGQSAANLVVHLLDPTTGTADWTTNLGEVRAYDLQAEAIQTSDDHIAVVSSKWAQYPFGYAQLSAVAQQCLEDFHSFQGHDWENANELNYWNTDAYVAKLDETTGAVIWETQFDSDPGEERECFPGNLKKQECMYKITEADEGGLVVSGNTSGNFDDNYLVKLQPDCQSRADYSIYHGMDEYDPYTNTYTADIGTTLWLVDMNVHGIVRIPGGATLTIGMGATISFADSKQLDHPTRIVVEPGGTLNVVNGAKLTSLDGCPNNMWDGILEQGHVGESQYAYSMQGHVNIGEGCVVESARVGVLVADHYPDSYTMENLLYAGSGGIVRATGATFRNNEYDVIFSPYENHTPGGQLAVNLSHFGRCSFTTDASLNDPSLTPRRHVYLAGVRGLVFRGCSWSGTALGAYAHVWELGTGIRSENSSFSVVTHCSVILPYGTPCPMEDVVRSSFSGLNSGIFATTFDLSRTFVVDQADFALNVAGIRMEGIQDAGITRCTFDVPEPELDGWASTPYGMYLDQCTGYEIEENAFVTSQPTGLYKKVGLVIKDSGPYANLFYNNSFDALFVGSLIEGKNATGDDVSGLLVKCNDYGLTTKNTFDVALTGEQVKVQAMQGSFIDPLNPDPTVPAGNRFSLDHDGSFDPEEDWFVEDVSTFVEYFHHTATATDRTRPDYHDPDYLLPTDVLELWPGKGSACPSNLDREKNREEMRSTSLTENAEYNASKDEYDATKDNGDTYSLLSYVSDPVHTSAQVRNALQNVAPKASEEAFQAAFDRDPAMNAWHITQALLSNTPLQPEVLRIMHASGLPSFYTSLVEGAQNGEVNILSLLESDMAHHAGRKTEALTGFGRDSWLDSLDLGGSLDSLKLFHEDLPSDNSDRTISGVLAALAQYAELEDMADAGSVASTSPELFALIKRYAASQQTDGWGTIASDDVIWLLDLAAQRDVQGSTQASAWLQALGEEPSDEIILLPLEERGMLQTSSVTSSYSWSDGPFIEVYPNPGSGLVWVVYDVPEEMDDARLVVHDLEGRQLREVQFTTGTGIVQLETDAWVPGLYLAELRLQGSVAYSVKLALQR